MIDKFLPRLDKCPTGIAGFDDISGGGLPRGRPTLLSGYAGTGKSLFALEFILHGIERYQEHGVFISFEESPKDLAVNVASLGFDLARYQADGQLRVIQIELEPQALIEAGEFDLDGLFIRLGAAIDAVGAKRIALDGAENLFAAFTDMRILRAEFHRLMRWLKERGLTAIITTERGKDALSRHGLEEYIADCVIALDHRIERELATRRLRIVKYRGSAHGSNEYPFVFEKQGFSVMPITSAGLSYAVSSEQVSSGIVSLDAMVAGGVYRGSSILVSGTSGTGKSSLAVHMVDAACRRGEHCLYLAMEESPDQIERNMKSIGIDLAQWRRAGLLNFHAVRPTASGLEMHLAMLTRLVDEISPKLVVVDPITAFATGAIDETVKLMLVRAVDLFKTKGITSLLTCLTSGGTAEEATAVGVSSLVDVWLTLRNLEAAGERTRGLYVSKARGMAHSNQVREFILTNAGVRLEDVVLDEHGRILTGSARQFHEELTRAEQKVSAADQERRRAALERKRHVLEEKVAVLHAEFEDDVRALDAELEREALRVQASGRALGDMATQRGSGQTTQHTPR